MGKNTLKFVIYMVPCNTNSDKTWSHRGPSTLTSSCFVRKIKEKNVVFLLKLQIFDIVVN